MNTKTLLIFAKRILNNSSPIKAAASLRQLRALLKEQGALRYDIQLLDDMLNSMPEIFEVAKKPIMTPQDVEIATRRAKERKDREAAMSYRGRC